MIAAKFVESVLVSKCLYLNLNTKQDLWLNTDILFIFTVFSKNDIKKNDIQKNL